MKKRKVQIIIATLFLCLVLTHYSYAIENIALGKPVSIVTNGVEEHTYGEPSFVTDGSIEYGHLARFVNDTYDELMVIEITIDLLGTYDISKIRFNMGNVQRASTWNPDLMMTPFDETPTVPGGSYTGAWTEHNGHTVLSQVTIVFEKTRTAWERDWCDIGEIEIYGGSCEPILLPGDFDNDGDIDANDLSAFSKVYGMTNLWEFDLINTTNVSILDQSEKIEGTDQYLYALVDKEDGDIGPGGCVPISYAMMFIHYFNITNPYDVEIDITSTSTQTINIVNSIGGHLDAYVENNSTWVSQDTLFERMREYTIAFDTESDPERVFVEWDLDNYRPNQKTNNEWIEIFKQKLSNNEPVVFAGHVVMPTGQGGHASLITGYKNIYGAEYLKIHDTWSRTAKWWRVIKNTSMTLNGNTENNLLCFMRDNGESLFYLNGMVSLATQMITTPSY